MKKTNDRTVGTRHSEQRDWTAAVIGGGKSTRFGAPKQRAMLDGRTLLDVAVDLAETLGDRVLVVDNGLALHHRAGVQYLKDRVPDCGPLGGIDTALAAADTPYVIIIPCDMPWLTSAVYEQLLPHRAPGRVVLAESPRGWEPLVSVWHRALAGRIRAALAQRLYAIRQVIRELDHLTVPVAATDGMALWYRNVNRPGDLAGIPGNADRWREKN